MTKVTCSKCQKSFDTQIEYQIHHSHKHYGPLPAPLTQPISTSNAEEAAPATPVVESSKSSNSYSKEPQTAELGLEEPKADEEAPYSLATSDEGIGELYPVLKDAYGNIIDGFHRLRKNPNWHAEVKPQIDTPIKLQLAMLIANFNRREMAPEEITQHITFLIKAGLKPEEIAKQTGITDRTVRKYMPQEFKNPVYVAMAVQSNAERVPRTVNLTPQETPDTVSAPSTPRTLSPITNTIQPDFSSPEIPKIEEPFPEGTPICPICAVSMDPTEYEEVKQAVAVKYGQQIQTLLFPTAEKKKGGKM